MPAKKASAKKSAARRAAPAKKAPVSKARPKATSKPLVKKSKPVSKNLAKNLDYEKLREDDELAAQYPAVRKNNFLSLIVLGVGTLLVIIGIYIQVNKSHSSTDNAKTTSGAIVATGANTGVTSSGATAAPGYDAFPVDSQKLVEQFYSYFNQDQFDQIPALYDNNFKTVPGLVRYFNATRLQNWKPNIIGDLKISEVNAVIDHPFVQRNPNVMVVQYIQSYTLKQDGKNYEESWYAYVMKMNGGYRLNGFECQTNCAASPFFQLR